MITLVTKQDLWWKERMEVIKYYKHGLYNTYIDKVAENRGRDFRHEYLSASLTVNNFKTPSGEEMIKTSEGYDENIRKVHWKKVLKTIQDYASE
jgi:hypothetical protein